MGGENNNLNKKNNKTKKKKKSKLKSFFLYLIIFTLIFAISGFVSYKYCMGLEDETDKETIITIDPENSIEIFIPLGSSTSTIAEILEENGIISWPYIFKLQSKINGYDGTYMSGKHLVSKDLTYDQLMKVLSSNPVSVTVTIPEGYNFSQLVKTLSDKKLIDKDSFTKTADTEKFTYKFYGQIPDRENKLEGYLFPDTYFFDPKSTDKEILTKFLNNFDNKFKPDFYKRAQELGMSVDEVIILASIIEKETSLPEERSIVSSVFHNRLKGKDPSLKKLQSCATVQYILYNKDGKIKETITDADTQISDPYNTYLHEGLPPGPICNPGLDSIEAALYPDEESQYLFFVAKGDGSHEFTKTLKEHEAAKKKYGLE